MASLQQKGATWYCQFCYHGKRRTFTVGPVSKDEAEAKANIVDYLLLRIRQGFVFLPPGMDIVTFMECDGKPPEDEKVELWDSLVLILVDIGDLLEHVKKKALHPCVDPMFCFAAHTGARRSEMLRALSADVDLAGGTVRIREKKRAHNERTTRRV